MRLTFELSVSRSLLHSKLADPMHWRFWPNLHENGFRAALLCCSDAWQIALMPVTLAEFSECGALLSVDVLTFPCVKQAMRNAFEQDTVLQAEVPCQIGQKPALLRLVTISRHRVMIRELSAFRLGRQPGATSGLQRRWSRLLSRARRASPRTSVECDSSRSGPSQRRELQMAPGRCP